MTRQLTETRVVIATNNPGKLGELAGLLEPFGIEGVPLDEWDLPEPVEDGETFAENALIKARAAAEATGLPAFADDSGITVEALGGFPGLHTARFLPTWEEKREEVERRLAGHANRRAAYNSALAIAWPGGDSIVFDGRAEGELVWPPRGDHPSFDPVFLPDGQDRTYAELGYDVKSRIDARAEAFRKLSAACLQGERS
jgi:XTP/dITP diphosphohydrolase